MDDDAEAFGEGLLFSNSFSKNEIESSLLRDSTIVLDSSQSLGSSSFQSQQIRNNDPTNHLKQVLVKEDYLADQDEVNALAISCITCHVYLSIYTIYILFIYLGAKCSNG